MQGNLWVVVGGENLVAVGVSYAAVGHDSHGSGSALGL